MQFALKTCAKISLNINTKTLNPYSLFPVPSSPATDHRPLATVSDLPHTMESDRIDCLILYHVRAYDAIILVSRYLMPVGRLT
jgi:hypothetical protein